MNEPKGFYFDFSRIGTGLKFACNLDLLDEIKIISEDNTRHGLKTEEETIYQKFWEETSDVIDNTEIITQFEEAIPQLEETFTQKFEETPEEIETVVELDAKPIEIEVLEDTAENYIKLNSEIKLEVLKEKYNLSVENLIELLNKNKIEFNNIELIQLYHLGFDQTVMLFPDLSLDDLKTYTGVTARDYHRFNNAVDPSELVRVFDLNPVELEAIYRWAIPLRLKPLRAYYNNDTIKNILNKYNLTVSDLIPRYKITFNDFVKIQDERDGKYKKKTIDETVRAYRGYMGINDPQTLINVFRIHPMKFLSYFNTTRIKTMVELYPTVNINDILRAYANNHINVPPNERLAVDVRYTITDYLRTKDLTPEELLVMDMAVKQKRRLVRNLLTAREIIQIYNNAGKLNQVNRDAIIDLCYNGYRFNGIAPFQKQNVNIRFDQYRATNNDNALLEIYRQFTGARVIDNNADLSPNEIIKAIFAKGAAKPGPYIPTIDQFFEFKIECLPRIRITNILDFYRPNSITEGALAHGYVQDRRAFRNVDEFLDQLIEAKDNLQGNITFAPSLIELNATIQVLINYFDTHGYFADDKVIESLKKVLNAAEQLTLNAGRAFDRPALHNLIQNELMLVNFKTLTAREWADVVINRNAVTIGMMKAWENLLHPHGNHFITFTPGECVEVFDFVHPFGFGEIASPDVLLREFPGITTNEFKNVYDRTHWQFNDATSLHRAKNTATPNELLNLFPLTGMDEIKNVFPASTAHDLHILYPAATPLDIAKVNGITDDQIKTEFFNNDFEGLRNLYLSNPPLIPINPAQLWNLYNTPANPNTITVDDLKRLYRGIGYDVLVALSDPRYNNPVIFYNTFDDARKPTLQELFDAYNRPGHPNPVTEQIALQLYDGIKPSDVKQVFNLNLNQMVQLYHNIPIVPQPLIDVEDLFNTYNVPRGSLTIQQMINAGLDRNELTLRLIVRLFKPELLRGARNLLTAIYINPITVADLQGVDPMLTDQEIAKILELTPLEYINNFDEHSLTRLKIVYPNIPIDNHLGQVGVITLEDIKIEFNNRHEVITLDQIINYYRNSNVYKNDPFPSKTDKRIYYFRKFKVLSQFTDMIEFFNKIRMNFEEFKSVFEDTEQLRDIIETYLDNCVNDFGDAIKEVARLIKPSWFLRNLDVITTRDPNFILKDDLPTWYNNFPKTIEGLLEYDHDLTPKQCYEILGIDLNPFDPKEANKLYKPPKRLNKNKTGPHAQDIDAKQLGQIILHELLKPDEDDANLDLSDLQNEIENQNAMTSVDLTSPNYFKVISSMDLDLDYNELFDSEGDLYGGSRTYVYPEKLKRLLGSINKDEKMDDVIKLYIEMMIKILQEEEFFHHNCASIVYADATKNMKMLLIDQLRVFNILYVLTENYRILDSGKQQFSFDYMLEVFYKITFLYVNASNETIRYIKALIKSVKEEKLNFTVSDLLTEKFAIEEIDRRRDKFVREVRNEYREKGAYPKLTEIFTEANKRLQESLKTDPIKPPVDNPKFDKVSVKGRINNICKWQGFILPDEHITVDRHMHDIDLENIYLSSVNKCKTYFLNTCSTEFINELKREDEVTATYLVSIFRILSTQYIPGDFRLDYKAPWHSDDVLKLSEIEQCFKDKHPLVEILVRYILDEYKYEIKNYLDYAKFRTIGYYSSNWLFFRGFDYVFKCDLEVDDINLFNKELRRLKDFPTIIDIIDRHLGDIDDDQEKHFDNASTINGVVYYFCDVLPKIKKYVEIKSQQYDEEIMKTFFSYPLDDPVKTFGKWFSLYNDKNTREPFQNIFINPQARKHMNFFMELSMKKIMGDDYGELTPNLDFSNTLTVEKDDLTNKVKPKLKFEFEKQIKSLVGKGINDYLKLYLTKLNKIRIIFYQIITQHPNISFKNAQLLVPALVTYLSKIGSDEDDDENYKQSFDLTAFDPVWDEIGDKIGKSILEPKQFDVKFLNDMLHYLSTNNFNDGCSWLILEEEIPNYIYNNSINIFKTLNYKQILDIYENEPNCLLVWLISEFISVNYLGVNTNAMKATLFLWFLGKLDVDVWAGFDNKPYANMTNLVGVNVPRFFLINDDQAFVLLKDKDKEASENYIKFCMTLLFESLDKLGKDFVNDTASEFANTVLKVKFNSLNIVGNTIIGININHAPSESIKLFVDLIGVLHTRIKIVNANKIRVLTLTDINFGFQYVLLKTLEDRSYTTNHIRLIDDFYQDNEAVVAKRKLEQKIIPANNYVLFYKKFLHNVFQINKVGIRTLTNTLYHYANSFKTLVTENQDRFFDELRTTYLDKLGLFIYIRDWMIIVQTLGQYNDWLTQLWNKLNADFKLNFKVIKEGFKVKEQMRYILLDNNDDEQIINSSEKFLIIEYDKNNSIHTKIRREKKRNAQDQAEFFNKLERELGKEVISLNDKFQIREFKTDIIKAFDGEFTNVFINDMYDSLQLHESVFYDYSIDYVMLTVLKFTLDDPNVLKLIDKMLYLISRTGSIDYIRPIIKYIKLVIENPTLTIKIKNVTFNNLNTISSKFFTGYNNVFYRFNNNRIYPELELESIMENWTSKIKIVELPFTYMMKKMLQRVTKKPVEFNLNFNPGENHMLTALRDLMDLFYEKEDSEKEETALNYIYNYCKFGDYNLNKRGKLFMENVYFDLALLVKIYDLANSNNLRILGLIDTNSFNPNVKEARSKLAFICYNYVMYKLGFHNLMFDDQIRFKQKDLDFYFYQMNKAMIPWIKAHCPYYPIHKIKQINKEEFSEILSRKEKKLPTNDNDKIKAVAIKQTSFDPKKHPAIDGMYAYDSTELKGGNKTELPTILKFIIIAFLVIILIAIVIKIVKTFIKKRSKPTKNKV